MTMNPKGKAITIARLRLRNDAVGGGNIPSDEMQCDFVISSGGLDGHYSRMNEQTLRNYADEAAASVPFMLDHSNDVGKQIGRTIAATYDERQKHVIATVSFLRDTDDTPEEMRINEYLRRIERGFYNSCSVGYRGGTEICDIDGKGIWDWSLEDPCPHVPGRSYDGTVCTYTIQDAHLREVSLVSQPSNQDAKLLRSQEWPQELREIKEASLDTPDAGLSLLEREGKAYRKGLIEDAIKQGVRGVDDFDADTWEKRFAEMDSNIIREQASTWKELGDAKFSGGRQTTDDSGQSVREESSVLVLPAWLFE